MIYMAIACALRRYSILETVISPKEILNGNSELTPPAGSRAETGQHSRPSSLHLSSEIATISAPVEVQVPFILGRMLFPDGHRVRKWFGGETLHRAPTVSNGFSQNI